jgi:hypothetical protein
MFTAIRHAPVPKKSRSYIDGTITMVMMMMVIIIIISLESRD